MKTFFYLVCLSLPLFAAIGLVIFMAGGKGKARPTQDELVDREREHLEGIAKGKSSETG
ncbi:MAG: hypothetical protein J4F31_11705 [Flavobacteriales bacterium]|nr:hypothetical protein [Flavobacteriales bacterium]